MQDIYVRNNINPPRHSCRVHCRRFVTTYPQKTTKMTSSSFQILIHHWSIDPLILLAHTCLNWALPWRHGVANAVVMAWLRMNAWRRLALLRNSAVEVLSISLMWFLNDLKPSELVTWLFWGMPCRQASRQSSGPLTCETAGPLNLWYPCVESFPPLDWPIFVHCEWLHGGPSDEWLQRTPGLHTEPVPHLVDRRGVEHCLLQVMSLACLAVTLYVWVVRRMWWCGGRHGFISLDRDP